MNTNTRNFTQLILLITLIIISLSLSSCSSIMSILNRNSAGAASVVFKVTGNGDQAVITYTRTDGSITEPFKAKLPWRSGTMNFPAGSVLVITAAGETTEGSIECSILVNGAVVNSNRGDPFLDKATCGYATHK